MSTNLIRAIAIGPAEYPYPTLPSKGDVINWNELRDIWDVIGKRSDGDIGELDVDAVAATPLEESVDIRAPRAQARTDEEVIVNTVDVVPFTVYNLDRRAQLISSTAIPRGQQGASEGVVWIKKAMIVEIKGIGIDYYPKVRIKRTGRGGAVTGDGGLHKMQFEAKIFGTPEYPAGWEYIEFEQ